MDSLPDGVGEVAVERGPQVHDVLISALYPVTGLKFLKWKYGKEVPPADVKARTMEEVRKEDDLVRKAKAGQLVEKSQKKAPAPSGNLRKFNVFVDGDRVREMYVW